MKRGFTLVELLVVIAMIAIIAAAMATSVNAARRRAMVSRALQEIREMTNAILAYEQYAPGRTLKKVANSGWTDCKEDKMGMIMGKGETDNGEKLPVLYRGVVMDGYLRDPWGTPYQYSIVNTSDLAGGGDAEASGFSFGFASSLPNYNRLTRKERK